MQHSQIRPLEDDDIAAAAQLLEELNPATPPSLVRERLATLLREYSHYHLVGAFHDGRLVGVAGAWIAHKVWCGAYLEIDNLIVAKDARSMGFGAKLILHLEALAQAHDCKILVLDSYTGNHASHKLYHRLGFEIWSFHFIKPLGDWQGSGVRTT
jgi:ribosomal protein S18 acetylase RimI-like enzyme